MSSWPIGRNPFRTFPTRKCIGSLLGDCVDSFFLRPADFSMMEKDLPEALLLFWNLWKVNKCYEPFLDICLVGTENWHLFIVFHLAKASNFTFAASCVSFPRPQKVTFLKPRHPSCVGFVGTQHKMILSFKQGNLKGCLLCYSLRKKHLKDDLERGIAVSHAWCCPRKLHQRCREGNEQLPEQTPCQNSTFWLPEILFKNHSLFKYLWIFRMNRWKSMWDISRQGVLRKSATSPEMNPCDIFWQIQAWPQFVWPGTEMVTRWSNDFDDWNSEVCQFAFGMFLVDFHIFHNLFTAFFWCFLNSMQSSFLLRWPRKAESEFQNHLQCQGQGPYFSRKAYGGITSLLLTYQSDISVCNVFMS